MIILGIDSSSKSGSAAVIKNGKLLAEEFINNGLTHSQTLMPLIKQTFNKANVSIKDIDLISVTRGPGSFTGLRIGMATVKGLAAVFDNQCVGVSTLEAAAVGTGQFEGIICSVMDARCKQVYNALFERTKNGGATDITRLCPDRALGIDRLKEELETFNKPIMLVGDGFDLCFSHFSSINNIHVAKNDEKYIHGNSVALLGDKMKEDAATSDLLTPAYIRLPQAQRELLKSKGKDM